MSNAGQSIQEGHVIYCLFDVHKFVTVLHASRRSCISLRQVLVQRLQKDILPKIESQIAELAKQDEPNDATKAITKQLKV